jgi:hypothetical protein
VVDGVEIALREELLDERVDELLVAGFLAGAHAGRVRRYDTGDHPINVGFRRHACGRTLRP